MLSIIQLSHAHPLGPNKAAAWHLRSSRERDAANYILMHGVIVAFDPITSQQEAIAKATRLVTANCCPDLATRTVSLFFAAGGRRLSLVCFCGFDSASDMACFGLVRPCSSRAAQVQNRDSCWHLALRTLVDKHADATRVSLRSPHVTC
jgi:hypothetical protein